MPRIGDKAPSFKAKTTQGEINFPGDFPDAGNAENMVEYFKSTYYINDILFNIEDYTT